MEPHLDAPLALMTTSYTSGNASQIVRSTPVIPAIPTITPANARRLHTTIHATLANSSRSMVLRTISLARLAQQASSARVTLCRVSKVLVMPATSARQVTR
jgi:hypothetical protein